MPSNCVSLGGESAPKRDQDGYLQDVNGSKTMKSSTFSGPVCVSG